MSKRKSTGASSEAPLKRPRANITKQLQVEKAVFDELFEQFKPTAEFAEKYKLDLPGADVYYKEDVCTPPSQLVLVNFCPHSQFIEPETATAWYEELNSLDTCMSSRIASTVRAIRIFASRVSSDAQSLRARCNTEPSNFRRAQTLLND